MSDKPKFPQAEALAVAKELCAQLAPHCERIEIAGSIRRRKPMVSDIEVLFIPKQAERKIDLFLSGFEDLADLWLTDALRRGILAARPNKKGVATWGAQNKYATHMATGIPVDFFATDAAGWARSIVIRTGPKEFNIRLIQSAHRRGIKVHAYGPAALVMEATGRVLECATERDFFLLCGILYREPWERK